MVVGRVVHLWRYPVKSMGAEALDAVDVSWHGLAGDRRWAFVRDGLERSHFPWLTIRERSDLWQYAPRFLDPSSPDTSATVVRTPAGAEHDVVAPELAEELGHGARVIKVQRGVFDTEPLSLVSAQTVAALGGLVGRDLGALRFRPNLVVEGVDGTAPFAEDAWVGRTVRVGGMVMRVDQRDKRCVMINVDPATAERDPAVLKAVAKHRDACLGVYGATVSPGRVAVGDPVELLD